MKTYILRLGLFLLGAMAALAGAGTARAQGGPEDAVRAHFDALAAQDYALAERYFSQAFVRAFKADVAKLNQYYLIRVDQLSRGYSFPEVRQLDDPGRETAAVMVEFADPFPEATVQATERLYYYLLREEVPAGAPGRDGTGRAWRIDIFDQSRYDTLADARRRSYLYTKEAWPDDASRELKSRQGLFRIQWALERYNMDAGRYPARLEGLDNRRDELLSRKLLSGIYPPNGYDARAMKAVDFGEKSSGDFSYYALDLDGDGSHEGYWLLLHGKDSARYYFAGRDTVYILSHEMSRSQLEQAQAFAAYWQELRGDELRITSAPEPLTPFGAVIGAPDTPSAVAPPAVPGAEAPGAEIPEDGALTPMLEGAGEQPAAEAGADPAQVGAAPAVVDTLSPTDPAAAAASGENVVPEVAPSQPARNDILRLRAADLAASLIAYGLALREASAATPAAAAPTPAWPLAEDLQVTSYGF